MEGKGGQGRETDRPERTQELGANLGNSGSTSSISHHFRESKSNKLGLVLS